MSETMMNNQDCPSCRVMARESAALMNAASDEIESLRATVAGLERELAEVKEALALSARYIVANDTALGGEAAATARDGKG